MPNVYCVPRHYLADNRPWSLRIHEERPPHHQLAFQRDRDRILYSRAFRRLAGKTQIFLPSSDDHVRTRLTHTLEVAQIASTIARRLGLDPFLTEAIALGHDLGHAPFGHVGERSLNHLMNGCYAISPDLDEKLQGDHGFSGFKHNLQGICVVTDHPIVWLIQRIKPEPVHNVGYC
jgi:dGTPase